MRMIRDRLDATPKWQSMQSLIVALRAAPWSSESARAIGLKGILPFRESEPSNPQQFQQALFDMMATRLAPTAIRLCADMASEDLETLAKRCKASEDCDRHILLSGICDRLTCLQVHRVHDEALSLVISCVRHILNCVSDPRSSVCAARHVALALMNFRSVTTYQEERLEAAAFASGSPAFATRFASRFRGYDLRATRRPSEESDAILKQCVKIIVEAFRTGQPRRKRGQPARRSVRGRVCINEMSRLCGIESNQIMRLFKVGRLDRGMIVERYGMKWLPRSAKSKVMEAHREYKTKVDCTTAWRRGGGLRFASGDFCSKNLANP